MAKSRTKNETPRRAADATPAKKARQHRNNVDKSPVSFDASTRRGKVDPALMSRLKEFNRLKASVCNRLVAEGMDPKVAVAALDIMLKAPADWIALANAVRPKPSWRDAVRPVEAAALSSKEKYIERKNKAEGPVEFLKRVFKTELAEGNLYRPAIAVADRSLHMALNQHFKGKTGAYAELLPTRSTAVDRRIEAILGEGVTPQNRRRAMIALSQLEKLQR